MGTFSSGPLVQLPLVIGELTESGRLSEVPPLVAQLREALNNLAQELESFTDLIRGFTRIRRTGRKPEAPSVANLHAPGARTGTAKLDPS